MQRLALSLFYTCTLAFTAMACGGARHIPDDPNTLEQSPPEQSGAGDTPTGSEVPQTDSNESEGSTSTGDAGSTDTQSGSGDSSGNTGDSNGACDRTGFAEATQSRAQATSGGWLFEASNDDLSEFVNISSFVSWDGPTVPGVYELNGINYKDCGLCLLAGTNCVDGSCEKLFYASEGTVEVTSTGTEDGVTVAGVLKNVVFQEVTIAEDYTSTRVAGGSTWCFDEYSFSEVAVDPNAPEVVEGFGGTVDSCVSGGNGTGIGNNIDNLRLQNCNGDLVSLHDQCGVSAAVWFVSTAGWCTACGMT